MPTGGERAYASLRRAILRGEFEPGAKLSEVSLSERLGISRTPVREALRELGRDGLVEVEPNRGARVVQWDQSDLDDIFPLRATLEAYAASRAARSRSPEDVAELSRLAAAMDDLGGGDAALDRRTELNNEFHRTIVSAAQSPRLVVALGQLIHVPLILKTFASYSAEASARSNQQHRDLVAAIKAQNPEWAHAVMTAHILGAYEEIRTSRDPGDLGTSFDRSGE